MQYEVRVICPALSYEGMNVVENSNDTLICTQDNFEDAVRYTAQYRSNVAAQSLRGYTPILYVTPVDTQFNLLKLEHCLTIHYNKNEDKVR